MCLRASCYSRFWYMLSILVCSRVLGVAWNVQSDEVRFSIGLPLKPPTRRGFLSTINPLFDRLVFAMLVVLEARLLPGLESNGTRVG